MFGNTLNKNIRSIVFFTIFTIFSLLIFSNTQAALECSDYGGKKLTQREYDEVVKACDAEIEDEKKALKENQSESSGIKNEIKKLDSEIKISQKYINKKVARANRLKGDIKTTDVDINNLERDLARAKETIGKLIFKKSQLDINTNLEAILSRTTLSGFFQDVQIIDLLEKKILKEIKEIKKEKDDLVRLTLELEEKESLERELANEKAQEKEKLDRNKNYRGELLGMLKKEEVGIKSNISDSEKTKQSILKRKYKVASGAEVTFGEAYNIINPYRSELGMDPAFVLAILFQESGWGGKIGGNIGQCTYDQKNNHGGAKNGYTMMSNSQKKNFETIMAGLGINPSSQKVSCPIPKDGSYGGAMGPAQFMPNTWMGTRSVAARILGVPATSLSPFVNQDAFVSSAVYLKQQYYSKSCSNYSNQYKHISSDRTLRERCAAARYYAGGAWFKFRMTYGESVVKRANRFREDIKTLNN